MNARFMRVLFPKPHADANSFSERELVVWGAEDHNLPARYDPVQSQYFAADVHVLPDLGHWPFIDEPERCRELLVSFLRRELRQSA